jgi:polyisoprenoid-binding protein YceI
MKNTYIIIGLVIVVAILAFVFGKKGSVVTPVTSDTDNAVTTVTLSDGTYTLDTEKSTLTIQTEYTNGATEEGTVMFTEGSVMVASGEPFVGTFALDATSLEVPGNLVLGNYLKGKEFLDVDTYPTATFAVNKIIPTPGSATTTGRYIVDGKLTIKDKTTSVSFPATFSQTGRRITADSSFAVNRAEWDLNGNKELKNPVLVELHIEASK